MSGAVRTCIVPEQVICYKRKRYYNNISHLISVAGIGGAAGSDPTSEIASFLYLCDRASLIQQYKQPTRCNNNKFY